MSGPNPSDTMRECDRCGAFNVFSYVHCYNCGKPLDERGHKTRSFPTVASALEALIDFGETVMLDTEGLELVTAAAKTIERFAEWGDNPPAHIDREFAFDEAGDLIRKLRAYRALHFKKDPTP